MKIGNRHRKHPLRPAAPTTERLKRWMRREIANAINSSAGTEPTVGRAILTSKAGRGRWRR